MKAQFFIFCVFFPSERKVKKLSSFFFFFAFELNMLKPTDSLSVRALFRFLVLNKIYCRGVIFDDFLRGCSVSNRPIHPSFINLHFYDGA